MTNANKGPKITGTGATPPSGPRLTAIQNRAATAGPVLTGTRKSNKTIWRRLLAVSALAVFFALRGCEEEPQTTATPPAPAGAKTDTTPLAFQHWIVSREQPLCEGQMTDMSCAAHFGLKAGSCVEPFTNYNGGNPQGNRLKVLAHSKEDGTVHTGFIRIDKARRADPSITERACTAQIFKYE